MSGEATSRTRMREELGYELGRELSARTVMFHAAVAEKMGLSVREHKALDLLNRHGAMTAGQLAEVSGLTSGAITGMVDRLEKAGFARRVADPKDRRKVIIEPTGTHYEQMGGFFAGLGQALLERYSDEELAVIHDFMARVPHLVQEETAKLKNG